MIDIKVGEKHKTANFQSTKENCTEENILMQIQYLRDKISEYEEVRHKQRYYTNIILTLIFALLLINTLPTIFKIIAILYNTHVF